MGDTPDREKGVHPWRMYQELRRRASGKKVGMEKVESFDYLALDAEIRL